MDRSTYPEDVLAAARERGSPLPEVEELIEWEEGGLRLILLRNGAHAAMPAWWNGYVRFPACPVPTSSGLLDDVRVHGGITFTDTAPNGSAMYGFDCNHAGDHLDPKDAAYASEQIRLLARGLALAVPFVAAAAEVGGFPKYLHDEELTPALRAIRAAYGEQRRHLVQSGEATAPLPANFWVRTMQHPWFADYHAQSFGDGGEDDPNG